MRKSNDIFFPQWTCYGTSQNILGASSFLILICTIVVSRKCQFLISNLCNKGPCSTNSPTFSNEKSVYRGVGYGFLRNDNFHPWVRTIISFSTDKCWQVDRSFASGFRTKLPPTLISLHDSEPPETISLF